MTEHRSFWYKSLGVICFAAAAVSLVPELAAQRFQGTAGGVDAAPIDAEGVEQVRKQLEVPGVTATASAKLVDARARAQAKAYAQIEGEALTRAHQAFVERRYDEAEQLLRALIEHRSTQQANSEQAKRTTAIERELDKARLLLAHLYSETDQHAQAAKVFAKISDDTPVGDFVDWLHARSLHAAGKPAQAAKLYESAYKKDTTLVKLRARVEQAHALADAKQWKEALPVLEESIDKFPDYPRRYLLLYQRARALEALGKLDDAAAAYQEAWFEFPHKDTGVKARQKVRQLAKQGHEAPEIDRDELFSRYRRLRINKHWPLAEKLFLELLEANKTEDGHSAFEHQILVQLALNDYVPQNYEEAFAWLEKLRKAYEAGHTAGIDDEFLYKYLSRTYSRMGQLDKALAMLEKAYENRGSYTLRSEKAQFFDDHGMYDRAKQIYDTFYSKWRKRGWQYTWLLYKTGEFQQAYENLTRLAERSRGQRRAKYMYWAARTLERGGNLEEAAKLYGDVSEAYELGYYGIQARNRLLDIQQRKAVDGSVLAGTQGLVERGDEVLEEMDRAGDALAKKQTQAPYRDPRLVQRTGEGEPAAPPQVADQVSHVKCEAETPEDQQFCELMAGKLTGRSKKALMMALAPMRPYSGLLSTGMPGMTPDQVAEAAFDDDESNDVVELGDKAGADAPAPRRGIQVTEKTRTAPRIRYNTEARIYWEGRSDSPVAFVKAEKGQVIGPLPDEPWAYDQEDYHGGLARAVDTVGELFPQLERAQWLRDAGYTKFSRWAIRDAALEFRGLSRRGKPYSKPHELPYERWEHLIDNRRREAGFWGYSSDEERYPVPDSARAKKRMLERHQKIYEKRDELDKLMLDAMKDVGDYHLVRRFTLGTGPWYRKDPQGPMRYKWMQAYPRAFPRQVLRESIKNGVNPYLVWALMTVESSYNPDSISPADALGLLQVIPRTGLKTAEMLGDEDFGPMDLLDEDIAIQHGAFYFSKLVKKFRGQELLAIAGYNGGPHRVAAWMDKRGRNMPMDEFVEEIPFNEARGYVKKVIRFLSLYLRVYEGVEEVYVGQKMRLDYLPQPNF
ncbi:tetratricopeptide repeat protein [Persicimonas caeni]|uniref:Tetratricopeptide repeat protein n=1 Tax=Persicimonas caeni TaxID=2292766 RepID=A0A4Y6Q0J9_PERCE|nr:transglycosylase SLT domain-containing protein [Persicimonas caeni]QDG54010.1 tetratricopeptide repeat protein [Persicimonas caeni]QED35231.1 tetratricopeptide repeat protein [Persicimonas caeni]